MNFLEIETKYSAKAISLDKFRAYCEGKSPQATLCFTGVDHFYSKGDTTSTFYRYRVGEEFKQLTFKRKTDSENNYVRAEHNITVADNTSQEQIAALVNEFGYEYNTSIRKTAFVYEYASSIWVYYIVYDMNMNELDRFIEIEIREEMDYSENEAWKLLVVMERHAKKLGISPETRITRSLFELYRK